MSAPPHNYATAVKVAIPMAAAELVDAVNAHGLKAVYRRKRHTHDSHVELHKATIEPADAAFPGWVAIGWLYSRHRDGKRCYDTALMGEETIGNRYFDQFAFLLRDGRVVALKGASK